MDRNKVDLLKQRQQQEFQLKINFINPPSLIILTGLIYSLSLFIGTGREDFLFFHVSASSV